MLPGGSADAGKMVVVGLGNDLLSDDGVGLYVARRLRERLDPKRFDILELSVGGLELVERLAGYRRAVVIDASRTGRRPVGSLTLHRSEEFVRSMRLACYHTVDFGSAIELVRRLGGEVPEEIAVFAIEVEDVETIHEGCTERVAASIESATEAIARWLGDDARGVDEVDR
jgi:hydrogenase maturation protease